MHLVLAYFLISGDAALATCNDKCTFYAVDYLAEYAFDVYNYVSTTIEGKLHNKCCTWLLKPTANIAPNKKKEKNSLNNYNQRFLKPWTISIPLPNTNAYCTISVNKQ